MFDDGGNFRWEVVYQHQYGPKDTGGWMSMTVWAATKAGALAIFWDALRCGQDDTRWARSRQFISGVEVRPV